MKNNNVLAIALALAACFVAVVAACTVVFAINPDAAGDFATQLLTALGTIGALIAGLAQLGRKQDATDRKVDEALAGVQYLSNGGMDAKVRAGVADVLPDHLIDPQAMPLIEQDRVRRELGPQPPTDAQDDVTE